ASATMQDSQSAGFKLGLGLNGHLRKMLDAESLDSLAAGDDMTTMSTLLGLAASFAGTGDENVERRILVCNPSFSANVPAVLADRMPLTRAASYVAIGLLFLGTKDRRWIEILSRELVPKNEEVTADYDIHEAFRQSFAASLGLGCVAV